MSDPYDLIILLKGKDPIKRKVQKMNTKYSVYQEFKADEFVGSLEECKAYIAEELAELDALEQRMIDENWEEDERFVPFRPKFFISEEQNKKGWL